MTKTMEFLAVDEVVIDEDLDFRTTGENVDELAASIEAFGLMQPITVAPANGDGKHHIVAGRRRLRAYRQLGRTHIEAIVDDELTDVKAQMIGQIIENLQREDVGVLDEARAYAKLGDYGMKQKDVAAALGVSSSHVSGRLALLKLPEAIVAKVQKGTLPVATATKLARAPKAVRDKLAGAHTIDDRAIAAAESDYQAIKFLDDMVAGVASVVDVPVAHPKEPWAYAAIDQIVKLLGLTDDDKPKSHEFVTGAYLHRGSFDDDAAWLDAIAAEKNVRGVFVSGTKGSLKAIVVTSANVTKDRAKEDEERRKVAEERAAAAQMKAEAFENALAPIVASPDKAVLITGVLTDFLRSQLGGYGNVLGTIMDAAERLGLTLTEYTPDGSGGGYDSENEYYRRQVIEWATQSSTNLTKAIIASQKSCTQLLVDQGILDDDVYLASIDPHTQVHLFEDGNLDEARLSVEAQAILAADRAAEAEDEELEAEIEAKVEQALVEKMAADGLDFDEDGDEWPYTAEEIDSVREQVRITVESEHAL